MHYFLLIYFNNKPLHVSSRLAAHHQEDQLCINSNLHSQHIKKIIITTVCTITFTKLQNRPTKTNGPCHNQKKLTPKDQVLCDTLIFSQIITKFHALYHCCAHSPPAVLSWAYSHV